MLAAHIDAGLPLTHLFTHKHCTSITITIHTVFECGFFLKESFFKIGRCWFVFNDLISNTPMLHTRWVLPHNVWDAGLWTYITTIFSPASDFHTLSLVIFFLRNQQRRVNMLSLQIECLTVNYRFMQWVVITVGRTRSLWVLHSEMAVCAEYLMEHQCPLSASPRISHIWLFFLM